MALLFLAFSKEEQIYTRGYALISLFAVVSVWSLYGTNVDQRYNNYTLKDLINQESKKLEEIIDISPEGNLWENTIAQYGDYTIQYLSLPTGTGTNHIFDGSICEKARYAIMPAGSADEFLKKFESNGYKLVFWDDIFVIFERNK